MNANVLQLKKSGGKLPTKLDTMSKKLKTDKTVNEATNPACFLGTVMLSAFELMTDEQLKEEQRVLTAEIEAAEHRLSSVENEIFYRANPECRRH